MAIFHILWTLIFCLYKSRADDVIATRGKRKIWRFFEQPLVLGKSSNSHMKRRVLQMLETNAIKSYIESLDLNSKVFKPSNMWFYPRQNYCIPYENLTTEIKKKKKTKMSVWSIQNLLCFIESHHIFFAFIFEKDKSIVFALRYFYTVSILQQF